MIIRLQQLAHTRTGDKGDTSNISLIAYRPQDFAVLEREVTAQKVADWFAHLRDADAQPVQRHVLAQLHALNFVLPGLLRGGVTRSLALDAHGKCLGAALLRMEIQQ